MLEAKLNEAGTLKKLLEGELFTRFLHNGSPNLTRH
jgi:hypothetical protein